MYSYIVYLFIFILEVFMLQYEKKIFIICTSIVFNFFPLVLLSKITKFYYDFNIFRT